jgi:hypothetical protein
MAPQAERLLDRIEDMERAVERDLRRAQKRLKQSIPSYLRQSRPLNLLAAPVVYSMILPIALLDAWVSLYQWLCFPLFGIATVKRRDHFVIDRHKLAYLNGIEKLNCVYCGYANGVFAYVRDVTGRTEAYWCPIKHATRTRDAHPHYQGFAPYGDAPAYKQRLPALRRSLKEQLISAGLTRYGRRGR